MQAGDDGTRRLEPVQEEVVGEILLNWRDGSIELEQRAVAQLAEASRPGSPNRVGTELSGGTGPLTSNPPTRVTTGFSGGTGDSANNPPTLIFRDEYDNQFRASPDGQGGWQVNEAFSRPLALAREYRTEVTTAIKFVSFALVAGGEALKAAGQETYGKGLKITGNALMGAAQFSDAGHYGHSAVVTWQEKGFKAAFADGRKAVLAAAGGTAAAIAAAVDGGENAVANTVSAGLNGAAVVSTGPTGIEQQQAKEQRERDFYEHDSQVEAQSHLDRPLPLPRNYTGFSGSDPESALQSAAQSLHQAPPRRPTFRSNDSQGSTRSARDMLPPQFVQRRDTQNSASTSDSPSVRPPATVRSTSPTGGAKRRPR